MWPWVVTVAGGTCPGCCLPPPTPGPDQDTPRSQHCLSLCLSVTALGSGMEALCPWVRQGRRGSGGNRLQGMVSDLGLEL